MSDWLRMAPDSRALENQIYLGASFMIWNDLDLFGPGSKQKLVIMLPTQIRAESFVETLQIPSMIDPSIPVTTEP